MNIRYSLLLLPVNLRSLTQAFNVEAKGLFLYNFVNENNLNYNGV